MLEEIKKIKSNKKILREFGLTLGGILVILGIIAGLRGRSHYPYFIAPGLILVGFGIVSPRALRPFHKIWMALSVIIGFFVSHIILIALFFAVITPIGLILKAFGKDILGQRIEKNKVSYWIPRENGPKPRESYEHQF